MYHRGNSKDAYLMSPPTDPAMRMLTPQPPYSMDVRRNSDVSAMSLSFTTCSSDYSTPATPMYTQSPLANQSLNTSTFDMSQVHGMPMEFEPNSTSFDERLTNSWELLDNTSQMDHTSSATSDFAFTKYAYQMDLQKREFVRLQSAAMATTQPWYPTNQYTSLDSHMDMTPNMAMDIDTSTLDLHPASPMHVIWNVPSQSMIAMDGSTIVPHDSMLDGDYVRVDTPNSMDSYDDMDVPLEQHNTFKQEPSSPVDVKPEDELSNDEGMLRRSICETRTGGKSVKCKCKFGEPVWKWDGDHVESDFSSIYRDEKSRWHSTKQPGQKFICKNPFEDDEEVPEGSSFCGKRFERTEHQKRHKNTHKSAKPFPCLLCHSEFNRNDNRWAHGYTHVRERGKGDGRNKKYSLRQVISVLPDPKHIEMLLKRWKKEVKSDYIPEDEEDDSLEFVERMKERNPGQDFSYDVNMAIWKIRSHRLTHPVDPTPVS
ncbi:c2h2 type conidiation transcription factor [Pyrenophora tritici-repentis]|nr:c2h2 type conidiation transcription factor [Pyrenophora tritici-repentis]KAI0626791.1 c2h2 type conidiation transcription factor [Pyrenophora tritici-repentis]PZD34695.1 hypothetical protein A1F96_01390 [Pyrenophora tritici-repentis]